MDKEESAISQPTFQKSTRKCRFSRDLDLSGRAQSSTSPGRPFGPALNGTAASASIGFQLPRHRQTSDGCSPQLVRRNNLSCNKDITYVGVGTSTSNGCDSFGFSRGQARYRFSSLACKSLKRKPEDGDGILSPNRKQHITEEKMAASMQSLSLETSQNIGAVKQLNDDSDFEDDSDIEDEDIKEESIDPIFELHVDLKEHMKQLVTILPESIVENMARSEGTSMALMPYVPREQIFLKALRSAGTEVKSQEENIEEESNENMEADNEMFIINWDSDSDNDLILE